MRRWIVFSCLYNHTEMNGRFAVLMINDSCIETTLIGSMQTVINLWNTSSGFLLNRGFDVF